MKGHAFAWPLTLLEIFGSACQVASASVAIQSPRCRYSFIFLRSYRCFRGFFGWLSTLRKGCLGLRTASLMTSNDLVIVCVCMFRWWPESKMLLALPWLGHRCLIGMNCFKQFKHTTVSKKDPFKI